jgi:hypothetical protein
MPNKLRFQSTGPFKTPAVVDFKGLRVTMKSSSLELHLVLAGGTELYLPLKSRALKKIKEQMADLHRNSTRT